MKTRIQKNRANFFFMIFWIIICPCFASNPSSAYQLRDTLEAVLETGRKVVLDTVSTSLFTGQYTTQIIRLVGDQTKGSSYDPLVNYDIQETYVLKFDGIDDIVEYGPGILHKFNTWTMEAWICTEEEKYIQPIYSELSLSEVLGSQTVAVAIFNGKLTLSFDSFGSYNEDIKTGSAIKNDSWHHIAAVKNRNEVFLYVDGSLQKTAYTLFEIDTGLTARGGTFYPEAQDFYAGNIYDLCIWNYALSEEEINISRHTDHKGVEEGLVSYWRFNHGSGNIVNDRSGNQRKGILKNGPEWVKTTAPYSMEWLDVTKKNIIDKNFTEYLEMTFNTSGLISGVYTAMVEILEKNTNDTVLKIPVSVIVTDAPDIYLSSDSLIFEEVTYGRTSSQIFRILNRGFDTLEIGSITTNNKNCTFDTTRLDILPGDDKSISFSYIPQLIGQQHAIITIVSNDPDQQETTLQFSAGKQIIPEKIILRWVSIATVSLIVLILLIILYRLQLKRKINKTLKSHIEEETKKLEQLQRIILHQSSLTILGEMAAGMLEEIKATIKDIHSASMIIQTEGTKIKADTALFKVHLDSIYKSVDNINKLIEHVKVFSSQQKSELTDKFSVNEVITDALSIVRVKLIDLNIETKLLFSDKLPILTGNPYKVEQIILNIVINAMEALKEKNAQRNISNQHKINITTKTLHDYVEIKIGDNGIGVSEKDKLHIFKPFFTTKGKSKSAGLGLSVARSLINEINGNIEIESIKGSGTTCTLKIPVYD